MSKELLPAFGWDTYTTADYGFTHSSSRPLRILNTNDVALNRYMYEYGIWANLLKGAGYIPVVNIIVGIARIILAADFPYRLPDNDEVFVIRFRLMHIIRGGLEILAGPLLLIVDITCAIFDHYGTADTEQVNFLAY